MTLSTIEETVTNSLCASYELKVSIIDIFDDVSRTLYGEFGLIFLAVWLQFHCFGSLSPLIIALFLAAAGSCFL